MQDWKNATRGVVHRAADADAYDLGRAEPGPVLAPFVEHFWWVRWGLVDARDVSTIPFPSMNLTVEDGPPGEIRHGHRMPAALLHGVPTRAFRVRLHGAGWVVGAKFRPGGWAAWSGQDASTMTDRVVVAPLQLGPGVDELREHLSTVSVDPSPDYLRLAGLIERMRAHPELRAHEFGPPRTLQRQFRRFVGVSPKWVLMRYRLQQAALELEQRPDAELAELACRLGWYDQAHFTADFRRVLGTTPGRYA